MNTTIGELKSKWKHFEELIPGSLYIVHNFDPDEDGHCWMRWECFEFRSQVIDAPDDSIEVELLVKGEGPVGILKELRHTYWGNPPEEGYIFYPKFNHIRTLLTWLEKYYEGT